MTHPDNGVGAGRYHVVIMLRCLLLATGLALTVQAAQAQLPRFTGYHPGSLPHNLPLPVEVAGEGVSEQACPVILYLPEDGAGPIPGAHPAAGISRLPAICAGYRLMVLDQTIETPMGLKSGRVKNARIPIFAYCPLPGQSADPRQLQTAIERFSATTTPAPAPAIPRADFALERVIASRAAPEAAPAARKVVVAEIPAAQVANPETPAETSPAANPKPSPPPVASVSGPTGVAGPAVPVSAETAPAAPAASRAVSGETTATVAPANPKTTSWDSVMAGQPDGFKDAITVGEVICDDRQRLRGRLPVHGEFLARPLSEVLLQLATASGLDFSIGTLPGGDPPITTRFTAPPFAALEQIARQGGVGIYHDTGDPLWVIRKIDPETLIARTYQLHEIHLGSSSGASGGLGFGTSFQDMQNGANGSTGGSRSGNANSSRNRSSSSGYSSAMGGVNGVSSATGSATSSTASDSGLFEDRFDQPSDVLFTIRSILGLIEKAPMISDLHAGTADSDTAAAARVSTRPSDNGGKVNGLVSYNAESNSLFVVGTERQHQWVEEYLRTVDRPAAIIGIDALFVETDENPSSKLGVNLTESLVNWRIGTPTDSTGSGSNTNSVDFGTLGHFKWPSGAILSAPSLGATINAMLSESKSRVARYPRVVTTNNREVRIATTTNIPIITSASTVVGVSTAATTTNSSTGTINTNYSSGTQEIGTIITLLPSRIDGDKIYLKISIEISSGENVTQGETLTGRIPTTSTVYEGEVIVPADRTLAIGGLERIAETSGLQRVPGISNIPVFGFLFKSKDVDFRNTNITLFITPRLIRPDGLPTTSQRQATSSDRALNQSADLEHKSNQAFDKKAH